MPSLKPTVFFGTAPAQAPTDAARDQMCSDGPGVPVPSAKALANLKKILAGGAMTVGSVLFPAAALAQHDASPPTTITSNPILNVTEVLTGLAAAFIAFQAAVAYRQGRIGRGITWVAVGMVIMAVGHFILVARRLFHMDPLGFLGSKGSFIAFSLAVFASFISFAAGFYLIRKAADQTR